MKVWDRPVRLLHWAGVLALASAWVTSARWTRWHEPIGYAVLGLVAARLAWGFVGSRHARFASFVRRPRTTWTYLRLIRAGREPRHLGHNPLGGWMVVALLACTFATGATGWLFTTDRFWGDELVACAHGIFAWTLLGLVVAHVAGVLFTSLRHRENLVAAMFNGTKRAPAQDDIA
jgi:cytochrome b